MPNETPVLMCAQSATVAIAVEPRVRCMMHINDLASLSTLRDQPVVDGGVLARLLLSRSGQVSA